MGERKPSTAHFDAVVDIIHTPEHDLHAYALVKYNFSFANGIVDRAPAVALENDIKEEQSDPRVPPYTDFWPYKEDVDVIVSGHAFSPYGRPSEQFDSAVVIGERKKEVRVFGPRSLRIVDGKPRIGPPSPVQEVCLDRTEAYGGTDELTPAFAEPGSEADFALNFDHPGLYPRNENGRGYLVVPDPERELQMPALEDPSDLLTEARVCVGSADLWYRQPFPCFLGYTAFTDFPRLAYVGLDAWYYGPPDERMPEVRRGWLPVDYRTVLSEVVEQQGYHIRFRQEAPPDMIYRHIDPHTPFIFYNMHPEKPKVAFELPNMTPRLTFTIDGKVIPAEPRLHKVVCYPEEERFTLLFSARAALPRVYLPGVHREIPLAVQVDHQAEIRYETPKTPAEKLAESIAIQEANTSNGEPDGK